MQRFPFADNAYYEVKSDDVPCQKNKVVPYDELYALKGVPFHSPEAVKHYVEKIVKEQEKKRRICNEMRDNYKSSGKRRIVV